MKHLQTYNNFLFEGLQEVKKLIKNQYKTNNKYNFLFENDDKLLKRIISIDPTSKLEKDKTGKYSKWLIKMWINNDPTITNILKKSSKEDDYKITDTLKTYHNNKKNIEKNNIFDYKSFDELDKELLKTLNINISDLDKDLQADIQNGNISVLLNNDKWIVLIPHNKNMSCKYGVGTKWCTAHPDHNAWDSYKDDKLYILLDVKNNLKPTYQFHFLTNQFMDVNDSPIDIKEFFEDNLDVFDAIFSNVKNKINKEELLSTKELNYLPKYYLDKYLTYFKNDLINKLNHRDIFELENDTEFKNVYVGFDEYNMTIPYSDTIRIDNFMVEEFIEYLDLYDDSYINFFVGKETLIDDLESLYMHNNHIRFANGELNTESEFYRILYDLLESSEKIKIDNKFDQLNKLTKLNIKLKRIEDYISILETLNIINDFENELIKLSITEKANHLEKLLKKETSEFPYFCDNYYGLEFNIDNVKEYITKNPNILNLEQILINTKKLAQDTFTHENYTDLKYSTDYNTDNMSKLLIDKLSEVINDIETYGNESTYVIGSEEIIKARNYLNKINLNIGSTISNINKKIKIEDILDNGKLRIKIYEKGKSKEHIINYYDLETYLNQYELQYEKNILSYYQFLNENNEFDIYQYEHGKCELAAYALHLVLGYDMYFYIDEEAEIETEEGEYVYDNVLIHAYCKDKNNTMYDITGIIDYNDLEDHADWVISPIHKKVNSKIYHKYIKDGFLSNYNEKELNKLKDYIKKNISLYK